MSMGEIISVFALLIAFSGLIINFKGEARKNKKENADSVTALALIQSENRNISAGIERLERKVDKIEERTNGDHEKIVDNEARIKNLENEVFKKRSA